MSNLFSNLPVGTVHLPDCCNRAEQKHLYSLCRQLVAEYPLMTPRTKLGYPLSLKVTSWGQVGWFGSLGKYEYLEKHENGKAWPSIPEDILTLMMRAAVRAGFEPFRLETVLLNYYLPSTGKLGRHQDVTEDDRTSPIVTISLGDSCIFKVIIYLTRGDVRAYSTPHGKIRLHARTTRQDSSRNSPPFTRPRLSPLPQKAIYVGGWICHCAYSQERLDKRPTIWLTKRGLRLQHLQQYSVLQSRHVGIFGIYRARCQEVIRRSTAGYQVSTWANQISKKGRAIHALTSLTCMSLCRAGLRTT